MTAVDAIKAGSAFVEFFGDQSQLDADKKKIGGDLRTWASAVSSDIAMKMAGGFNVAQAAAVSFGAQAATGMAIAATGVATVSKYIADVPNRFSALLGGFGAIVGNIGDIARGAGIANFALTGTSKLLQRMGFESAFVDKVAKGMKTVAWDARRAQFGIDLMLAPFKGVYGIAAKLSGMGLGMFSAGVRSLGGYTGDIDYLAGGLNRSSTNALRAATSFRVLIPLIRLAGFTARTTGAILSMPFKLASAGVGLLRRATAAAPRGLMGGARLASIASMGSMVAGEVDDGQEAVNGAASNSEQGVADGAKKESSSGGFMKYLQPVLTGLMIAGPIGAAAVGLGMFIAGVFKKSGQEGGGFFAKLAGRAQSWAAWIGGMFSRVGAKITEVFGTASATGESFLTKLEKAFIPLTHAIENVWLPAVLRAIEWVGSFFKKTTDSNKQSWGEWILSSVNLLADFIGNIDLYFQIGVAHVGMFIANSWESFKTFFVNIGELFVWFGDNWRDVLTTMADYAMTIFINMGENIRNTFKALFDYAKGGFTGKFDLKWKGLTDGAVSSLKELPKLTQAAIAEMTPELEALYAQLGKRQADAAANGQLIAQVDTAAKENSKSKETKFGAVSASSQEGYSLLAQLQNQVQKKDPVVEEQKKTVKEQKETNKHLANIARDYKFKQLPVFEIP